MTQPDGSAKRYSKHLRLSLSGEIRAADATLVERFSLRINMSDPSTGFAQQFSKAGLDDVVADSTAFWQDGRAHIARGAVLTEIKWARIGTDGKYTADPFVAEVRIPGGGQPPVLYFPPQVSLAVSLNTKKRGPRGRGRMFLPCPAIALGTDARVGLQEQERVGSAVQAFLRNLNNWPALDTNDPKVTIASSYGENHDVTSIRVGRTFDTIRSRRESIQESYGAPLAVS